MTNYQLITELNKIGKLPTAEIAHETNFLLKEFSALVQQLTVPLEPEIAIQLINLSPPVNEGCHGVEWDLIHAAETVDINELQNVLNLAEDGEVKRTIQTRLNNYYKKQANK